MVLVIYGVWLLAFFGLGHDAMDFTYRSRTLLNQSHASSVITSDPRVANDAGGYDSQFFYYLAVDPVNARYYMDANTYRYTRILYPMVARALGLGAELAVFLAPMAAVYGRSPGSFSARTASVLITSPENLQHELGGYQVSTFQEVLAIQVQRTLEELRGEFRLKEPKTKAGRRKIELSSFALAALTRETTALFTVLYGASLLARGPAIARLGERVRANWRKALVFLAIALVPLAAWKAFLLLWLGPQGDAGLQFTALPFQGIWHWRGAIMTVEQMDQIRSVVIPAVVCGVTALVALARGIVKRDILVLLAHVLLFVVLLQAASYANYSGSGRISAGVVLAALLCVPVIGFLGQRAWLWISSTLWLNLLPFWLGVPVLHFALSLVKR